MEAQCKEVRQRAGLGAVKEPDLRGSEEEGSRGRGSSALRVLMTSCNSAELLKEEGGWGDGLGNVGSALWLIGNLEDAVVLRRLYCGGEEGGENASGLQVDEVLSPVELQGDCKEGMGGGCMEGGMGGGGGGIQWDVITGLAFGSDLGQGEHWLRGKVGEVVEGRCGGCKECITERRGLSERYASYVTLERCGSGCSATMCSRSEGGEGVM